MESADETIKAIKQKHPDMKFSTTSDVSTVLTSIASPGDKQELKREVITKLFTARSPQGFTTVDTIEGYREF